MNGITLWDIVKGLAFIAFMIFVCFFVMDYLSFLVDTSIFIYRNYSYTHVFYYIAFPIAFFVYIFSIALSKVVEAGATYIHFIKKNTVEYRVAAVMASFFALYNLICVYIYFFKMK